MMLYLQISILVLLVVNLFFLIKRTQNKHVEERMDLAMFYGTMVIFPYVPEAIKKIEVIFKEKAPIHESYPKIKEICSGVADICLKKAKVHQTNEIKIEFTNWLMTKYIDDLFALSEDGDKFRNATKEEKLGLLNG